MYLKQEIQNRSETFSDLCSSHNVRKLYAFGSSITDEYQENKSDIDLLVEIDEKDPVRRGEILMSFWDKLEAFFGRKVDLLTDDSLKNPILRKNIEQTKVLIYDGAAQKVLV